MVFVYKCHYSSSEWGIAHSLLLQHVVSLCVLLNMSLYFGNILIRYFVDFVAVNLVSWSGMKADVFYCISFRMFGSAVFSDTTFYVANCFFGGYSLYGMVVMVGLLFVLLVG
jgi:hypothetical protein